MKLSLTGGRVLHADGTIKRTPVNFDDGKIVDCERRCATPDATWDVGGHLVLPAMVDLHGDAFACQTVPRLADATTPERALEQALEKTDRDLVTHGIATAYRAVTYSWEPGLWGRDTVVRVLDTLDRMRARLLCDTRVHLRWEQYNTPGAADVADWINAKRIDILAFGDHMNSTLRALANPQELTAHADRAGLSTAAYADLLDEVETRKTDIRAKTEWLAMLADRGAVVCASTGDVSPKNSADLARLGVNLRAFPLHEETAPHMKRPMVMDAFAAVHDDGYAKRLWANGAGCESGVILASNGNPSSLLQAPFKLSGKTGMDFARAWNMVSQNPAAVAGLSDRGQIKAGQRADVVVVDDRIPEAPRVVATFVEGRGVQRMDGGYRMCA